MATTAEQRTPVQLWIVGILALLWNAFGCYDYLMTRQRNTDYLAMMMPGTDPNEMLAYVDTLPIYVQFGWGLGVWGGLLGAVLMLFRSRWATVAFGVSLIGALVALGYQIINPGGPPSMHEGAGAVIPYVLIVIAALLLWYSWSMDKKGVLR